MNEWVITKIVNQWDPVGLLAMHCPTDEYAAEIAEIYNWCTTHKCDIYQLSTVIYETFRHHFGEDVFLKTMAECTQIAESICNTFTQ